MNTTQAPTFHGRTADEWREQARAARQRSADSWERSDTDGFMSQWAADTMAGRYDVLAAVAERGGVQRHVALFDADGRLVAAKYMETRYGWSWAILENDDPRSRIVGWFNESNASTAERRAVNNLKKGYRLGHVWAPVALDEKSYLLYRADDGFSRDVEIIDVEGL